MPSTGLTKATLTPISAADDRGTPTGDAVAVQFNPTSLRMVVTNQVDQSQSRSRQRRQMVGNSSTKLTVTLVFDTADEAVGTSPRSVRQRTQNVEQFILPVKGSDGKLSVPKCRFQWGTFILDGLMDSFQIDIDLFAADGTPLRAKCDIGITEQKRQFEPEPEQPTSPPEPGQPSNGPGTSGGSASDSSAQAIDGESAAQFAARNGLDPEAWRSFADQLDDPLSLSAGLSIDFSASASLSLGVGASFSVGADIGVDIGVSLSAGASLDFGVKLDGGFSLSAAGGVSAAVERQSISTSSTAAQATRNSFPASLPAPSSTAAAGTGAVASSSSVAASPTATSSATALAGASSSSAGLTPGTIGLPTRPDQPRPPLQSLAPGSRLTNPSAPSAPPPPVADPRATSYGLGVPLRPSFSPPTSGTGRNGALTGNVSVRPRVGAGLPPTTTDPTVPPWVALQASSLDRATADSAQGAARPLKPCGCTGACTHVGALR